MKTAEAGVEEQHQLRERLGQENNDVGTCSEADDLKIVIDKDKLAAGYPKWVDLSTINWEAQRKAPMAYVLGLDTQPWPKDDDSYLSQSHYGSFVNSEEIYSHLESLGDAGLPTCLRLADWYAIAEKGARTVERIFGKTPIYLFGSTARSASPGRTLCIPFGYFSIHHKPVLDWIDVGHMYSSSTPIYQFRPEAMGRHAF